MKGDPWNSGPSTSASSFSLFTTSLFTLCFTPHSPYGTQMFLTCVACVEEFLPFALFPRHTSRAATVARPRSASCWPRRAARRPRFPSPSRNTTSRRRRRARRGPAPARRGARDDVDDAGRHVGGLEHLVEVGRGKRRALRRYDDDRVAQRHGRRHQRDKAQQRCLLRGRRCRSRRSALASRA